MKLSRGLALTALCVVAWGVGGFWAESSAQVYEDERRALDLSPDPIARSPRLLGMGQLTLAADPNNKLGFWDFAGNPIGVLDADSVSTFALWPVTTSSSGRQNETGTGRERQQRASREMRVGYEGWRRVGTTAYGLYGDAATLRADGMFSPTSELRHDLNAPRLVAVLNGHMPSFQSERLQYALTAFFGQENENDRYRTLLTNGSGDYLGKKGDFLPPPDFFTPDEYHVSKLGAGAALSYRFGNWMTATVGGHGSSSYITGANEDVIHEMGTGEHRPLYTLETGALGRGFPLLGSATAKWPMEWIYDGRLWTSSTEDRWVFTLKAGINQDPYSGRGKYLDRDEEGSDQAFRMRWWSKNIEWNGAARIWKRTVEIKPPDPNDLTSFNRFIDLTALREGADTLMLPDSIRHNRSEDRTWSVAYGATWKMKRGLLGLEYHYGESKFSQTLTGVGPHRRVWDMRAGVEHRCSGILTGRMGYIYRSDDRDLLSQRNEFTTHTATSGLTLSPAGSMWTLDLGWSIEWLKPDEADPVNPRESRQATAAQVRWAF